ncbi:MAG: cell surface protein, partial [Candidatus Dadabacteria bacterium]|nr:cell surface protein [Candidatus Dadabacteria bacterium]
MLVGFVVVSLLVLTFISEGEISAENKLPIIQKQAKANPKISSLIMKRISKMQSLGITRENVESVYPTSISDPLVKVDKSGNIQTYIYMENMDQENISKLESMNVKIEIVNSKYNLIQAWIPFDIVEEVASLNFVKKITPPSYGILRTGSVNSKGDMVMRSDKVRNELGFDGTGVRVGVISDGVDSMAVSQSTGDLTNNIDVNP